MNSKESGNKKDKLSSKEKRLAVPTVVNSKEPIEVPVCSSKGGPVKLRRRESGKVAPTNEPIRKSVVSRWLHNLTSSGSASQDVKKKRASRDLSDGPSALDLPEHGVVCRPETIPEQSLFLKVHSHLPPPAARAQTLSVQHDNRSHRWSSYEPYDSKEIMPHMAEKSLSSSARSLSEESIQVQQVQLSLDHILSLKQTDLNPAGSMKTCLSHSEVNLSVPQKSENSVRNVPVTVQVVDNDAEVPQRNQRSNSQGSRSSVGRIESIEEDVAELGNTSKSDAIKAQIKMKDDQIIKALAEKAKILGQLFHLNEKDLNVIAKSTDETENEGNFKDFLLKSIISADQLTKLINTRWLCPTNYTAAVAAGPADAKKASQSQPSTPTKNHSSSSDLDCNVEHLQSDRFKLLQEITLQLQKRISRLSKIVNLDQKVESPVKVIQEETQNPSSQDDTEKKETCLLNSSSLPEIKEMGSAENLAEETSQSGNHHPDKSDENIIEEKPKTLHSSQSEENIIEEKSKTLHSSQSEENIIEENPKTLRSSQSDENIIEEKPKTLHSSKSDENIIEEMSKTLHSSQSEENIIEEKSKTLHSSQSDENIIEEKPKTLHSSQSIEDSIEGQSGSLQSSSQSEGNVFETESGSLPLDLSGVDIQEDKSRIIRISQSEENTPVIKEKDFKGSSISMENVNSHHSEDLSLDDIVISVITQIDVEQPNDIQNDLDLIGLSRENLHVNLNMNACALSPHTDENIPEMQNSELQLDCKTVSSSNETASAFVNALDDNPGNSTRLHENREASSEVFENVDPSVDALTNRSSIHAVNELGDEREELLNSSSNGELCSEEPGSIRKSSSNDVTASSEESPGVTEGNSCVDENTCSNHVESYSCLEKTNQIECDDIHSENISSTTELESIPCEKTVNSAIKDDIQAIDKGIQIQGGKISVDIVLNDDAIHANKDDAILENHDVTILGNQDDAILGNQDVKILGNQDDAILGNQDVKILGNQDDATHENQDDAILESQDNVIHGNEDDAVNVNQANSNHNIVIERLTDEDTPVALRDLNSSANNLVHDPDSVICVHQCSTTPVDCIPSVDSNLNPNTEEVITAITPESASTKSEES